MNPRPRQYVTEPDLPVSLKQGEKLGKSRGGGGGTQFQDQWENKERVPQSAWLLLGHLLDGKELGDTS